MPSSAEEFYSRRLYDAQVLLGAARAHAADGDVVAALATMVGGDVATVQAAIWERINVAPLAPQRQLFQAAQTLSQVMAHLPQDRTPGMSLGGLVVDARFRMLQALDDALADEVESRWADPVFLEEFPAPGEQEMSASLAMRTDGLPVPEFIASRRADAARAMLRAQEARVRGATAEAIRAAYDADFLTLEAYLAESASVVQDTWLLTAIVRWELAAHAVGELAGLPADFAEAARMVRSTMVGALGDADGTRLEAAFEPL